MGSRPVPAFADSFMARIINPEIQKKIEKYNKEKVKSMPMLKRFLHDYKSLLVGTKKNYIDFWKKLTKFTPKSDLQ